MPVSKTFMGPLVWIPLKAEPETRIWVRVIDLRGDARKEEVRGSEWVE